MGKTALPRGLSRALVPATGVNSTAAWRRCADNGRFKVKEILRQRALETKLGPHENPQQVSVLHFARSNVFGYFRGGQAKLSQDGEELPDERQQEV